MTRVTKIGQPQNQSNTSDARPSRSISIPKKPADKGDGGCSLTAHVCADRLYAMARRVGYGPFSAAIHVREDFPYLFHPSDSREVPREHPKKSIPSSGPDEDLQFQMDL